MLLLVILFVVGINAMVNPYGPTIANDYTNCAVQLMELDFNESGLLIFANNKNVNTAVFKIRRKLLKYIHTSVRFSVQVAYPGNEVAICGKDDKYDVMHKFDDFEAIPRADYFIVIVDNYIELTYLASKLIRSRSWNPRAKFIVLLLDFTSDDRKNVEHVENILTCFFKYNVINVVVVVPQADKIRNALIYSWRPYDPPKYCGYDNETAKNRLIIEKTCQNGVVHLKKSVFKDRIPQNMKGCVLHILALERQPFVSADENEPNIEKKLVNEVLKTFNYEAKYEVINFARGERDSGQWNGVIGQLVARRGHVLLGGIFPDNDVHEDFECSSPYLADSYAWVVPRAYPSPRWTALMIIFQENVWLLVIMFFIIAGLSWNILGKLSQDASRNKSLFHCFLSTWICTLGFCTYLRPKKETLRVFFVFLNLYCMICITGYQTKLIDVLRNPSFDYQIKTVEELVGSRLKFGGFEELHDLFHNSSDPFDFQLGEKWVDVKNISQAMIDVAVHRNFSLLCSRLELSHISANMPELSDAFGNYKYYVFELNVFSVPMEMVTMKGFAFMKEFSENLNILRQVGLNSVLRRFFAFSNLRRRAKLLRSLEWRDPNVVALSLEHLQGGFLALMFGYVIGTLVLIGEIFVNSKLVKKKISQCRNILRNYRL